MIHRQRQPAFSNSEAIIALIILGVTAVAITRFAFHSHAGLRQMRLQAQIRWELQANRERIGSWKAGEVTKDRIESLPVPDFLTQTLTDARWCAQVTVVDKPLKATRVTLWLEHQISGQPSRSNQLVFWVPQLEQSNASARPSEGAAEDLQSNAQASCVLGSAPSEIKRDAPC